MLAPRPLCMWSPLIEAGSSNLVLLCCSCSHACLAAYTNVLWRDLNTTCITTCDFTAVEPISGGMRSMEAFWSKPSVKVEIKTTWEVVSTCEVMWCARLNTSKEAGNRQEDRSSQWEATKRSVGLSTARMVAPTEININVGEWRLFDISSASTSSVWVWLAEIEPVIDIATPRQRLKSSEDRSLRSSERSAACIRSLAKLGLVTFSLLKPASRLYYWWSHWLIECSKLYYRKNWKDIRLFCLIVVVDHKLHLIWR